MSGGSGPAMLLKGKGGPRSRPSHPLSGISEVTRKNCRPNGAPPNGRQPALVSDVADTSTACESHRSVTVFSFIRHRSIGNDRCLTVSVRIASPTEMEDTMGWQLFSWILAAGVFSMLWVLYLSIRQGEKQWKPVAQAVGRHGRRGHRSNRVANA